MAARTWDDDFRKDAIDASLQKLGDEYLDDPFRYDGSFILPVTGKPGTPLVWIKMSLWIPIFICCALGAWFFFHGLKDVPISDPSGLDLLMVVGGVLCLVCAQGIIVFLLVGDRYLVTWYIGERARKHSKDQPKTNVMVASLLQVDSKDFKYCDDAVILFDDKRNRMLLEGVDAIYQIRSKDVRSIHDFEHVGSVGVVITYQLDQELCISIGFASRSLLQVMIMDEPLLKVFTARIRNRVFERTERWLNAPQQFQDVDD